MPLTPTTNLKKYEHDLDLLADKQGRLSQLIDELQNAEVDGPVADATEALATLANEIKSDYNAAVTLINELKADFNALLAKLDSDSGVDGADYVSTLTIAATNAGTVAAADVDYPGE